MSTVSDSLSFRDLIDRQAEAEAASLAWFEEELEQYQPVDPIRVFRDMAHAAEARGLAPVPFVRYPLRKAVAAHLRHCDAFKATGSPAPIKLDLTTRVDRKRRAARRQDRLSLALTIRPNDDRMVDLETASRLVGVSVRRLQRLAQLGQIGARRERRDFYHDRGFGGRCATWRWVVNLADVRRRAIARYGSTSLAVA